jgi:hypothetical protein
MRGGEQRISKIGQHVCVLLINGDKGEEKTFYLDSVRSIAQSRLALRTKPQCTRSYMRIVKNGRQRGQS